MRSRLSITITCARDGNGQITAAIDRSASGGAGESCDRNEKYKPENHRKALLIGKSMGGRIGCHVSLEEKVNGLVCFGYPLVAMGDSQRRSAFSERAVTIFTFAVIPGK